MKFTFRWYGKNDNISLSDIKQIPCIEGIVTAIYDVNPGELWDVEIIDKMKSDIESAGLAFEVVESVPVHEDIKFGGGKRDLYIENYKENIRRLGNAGVKCVCYNFMPVFDWLRSDLCKKRSDGSTALSYNHNTVLSLNPLISDLSLPGWDSSYDKRELRELLNNYQGITAEKLKENLAYFLNEVIPVAEKADVKMAIHPDDPPWGIFGLPRIMSNREDLREFLKVYDSPYNGVTFCTGSFGSANSNDLLDMIKIAAGRIPFAHLRNVKITSEKCFEETGHISADGDIDMYKIIKALYEKDKDCYVRPDHGRMIWGENGRPGYGLYDRALGAMYLYGIAEGIEKGEKIYE